MVNPIPNRVRRVWDEWNIRGVILLSLSLQTILILGAPFRKRTGKKLVIMLIWLSYLFADWAASFAVGLISNNQLSKGSAKGDETNDMLKQLSKGYENSDEHNDMLAFWAPFLLLHLGGPDTITAFALEDNELWLRHLLGLIFQVVATVYVFLLTLPENKLWIPTFLMFLAGIIKYIERTRSLYLASLDSFRDSMLQKPDPGPNYAKLMEEYASKKDARLPTQIKMTHEPDKESKSATNSRKEVLDKVDVVEKAYDYFKIFRGLIVDLIFSFRERNESREFFQNISSEDALRVIEVELNFIYEVLYTKVVVIHNIIGYIFRFLSFSSVVVALGLFFSLEKQHFKRFDVGISYTLLFGAICLDVIAFFMLIFSDWTIATTIKKSKKKSIVRTIFNKFLSIKSSRWSEPVTNDSVLATPLPFRRWSEYMSGYNLIKYCLKERPKKLHDVNDFSGISIAMIIVHYLLLICDKVLQFWRFCRKKVIDYLGVKDFLDELQYVTYNPITKKLWKFIFDELQEKSWEADDAETTKRICSARGAYILQENELKSNYSNLMPYIEDVTYDESILLWHVATKLCFLAEDASTKKGPTAEEDASTKKGATADDLTETEYREFSKLFSDYMLYLLVMQPTMMSAVAGIGQIRFQDTCAEAEKFFFRRGLKPKEEKKACENILGVNTDVKPVHVKGDRSKSVLFDACMLAKELKKLKGEKWKIMSRVWVEMLSYGASHCRANTHAQQVSKGGELISFVWLLMAHFGLGEQFQINEGHARAKLIVGK